MGSRTNLEASTFAVKLKATLCSTGGCVGSPEDKVAVMTAESLFVLTPHLTLDELQASKLFALHRVNVKNRFKSAVELEHSVIHAGTKEWKESRIAISEHANRCVIYPGEEIFRDSVHQRSGVRFVDWSPRGVDKFGRVVMVVVTIDGRASIFAPKGANQWQELVDLTNAWQGFYLTHGRAAPKHDDAVDERPVFNLENVKDIYQNPLVCHDVVNYIDALEDINIVSGTWGQMIRRPQVETPKNDMGPKPTIASNLVNEFGSKATKPIGILVLLSKSGVITFWGVHTPLLGLSSLFLLRIDYTYAITRRPGGTLSSERATFIKLCDLDAATGMLVVGLSNGAVHGLVHTYECALDGSFSLKMTETLSLCERPVASVPIITAAWSTRGGLLCLGYGRHLLVACVKLLVSERTLQSRCYDKRGAAIPTYQVERSILTKPSCVLGQITGVRIDDRKVYITTLDGYLASKDLTQINPSDTEWQVLWSTSSCPLPNEVHWEFHGLSMSANGVFVTFVEQPVNYLDAARQLKLAQLVPQIRFLSFWPDTRLLELVFDSKLPLHRKSDGLLALAQRWVAKVDNPSPLVKHCVEQLQFSTSNDSLPSDWPDKPLPVLHLYRFILSLIACDINPEIRDQASRWLTLVDCLLEQRHWDRCFRTFLQSQVQRQAADCLLVIRMATLILEYSKQSGGSGDLAKVPYKIFIGTLLRTAEQASQLAGQLYVHRFKLPAQDLPTEPQRCIVCSERVLPDITFSKCERQHPIPRCMQTLDACSGVAFRRCSLCGRIAVAMSPQDRPSVWRMGVVHPMCIFCDVTLIWEDF